MVSWSVLQGLPSRGTTDPLAQSPLGPLEKPLFPLRGWLHGAMGQSFLGYPPSLTCNVRMCSLAPRPSLEMTVSVMQPRGVFRPGSEPHLELLRAKLCPPQNSYVEVPASGTSENDCI